MKLNKVMTTVAVDMTNWERQYALATAFYDEHDGANVRHNDEHIPRSVRGSLRNLGKIGAVRLRFFPSRSARLLARWPLALLNHFF